MKSQFQQICDDLREDRRDPDRVNAKPVKPGLYLRLWHGRVDPDQEMDDWGDDGPIIGPLEYGHMTYASEIKLGFEDVEDHDRFFIREVSSYSIHSAEVRFTTETMLNISNDMVFYEGVYYGDWSFYCSKGGTNG